MDRGDNSQTFFWCRPLPKSIFPGMMKCSVYIDKLMEWFPWKRFGGRDEPFARLRLPCLLPLLVRFAAHCGIGIFVGWNQFNMFPDRARRHWSPSAGSSLWQPTGSVGEHRSFDSFKRDSNRWNYDYLTCFTKTNVRNTKNTFSKPGWSLHPSVCLSWICFLVTWK